MKSRRYLKPPTVSRISSLKTIVETSWGHGLSIIWTFSICGVLIKKKIHKPCGDKYHRNSRWNAVFKTIPPKLIKTVRSPKTTTWHDTVTACWNVERQKHKHKITHFLGSGNRKEWALGLQVWISPRHCFNY